MIKSIVGFGDSWIYGNGIGLPVPGDPTRLSNCMLGQIGNNLNLPTINYSRPGSSLTSMMWEFSKWAKQTTNVSDHLVIVGLTYDSRESWWPSDQSKKLPGYPSPYYVEFIKYTTSEINDEWTNFIKTYIVHSNHDELKSMRYWQAINFIDSYCNKHNIPVLQINVWHPTTAASVDSLYSSDENMVDLINNEIAKSKKNLIAPCKHPNEAGAKFLADIFTKEIHARGLIK